MNLDCAKHIDNVLVRHFISLLCFLYRVANRGHAFEASIGIPSWMCWFSTPDLVFGQLLEATLLLMLLASLIILAFSEIILESRGLRGWDWKADVRLVGGLGLLGWLDMCLMRALFGPFVRNGN